MNLTNEQRFLIGCIVREAGDGSEITKGLLQNPLDWQVIKESADWHRIQPLVYDHFVNFLEREHIPRDIKEHFGKFYFANFIKNQKLYEELEFITEIFAEKGIDTIPLKGSFLGKTVYGNDAVRPLTDIDIMINIKDIDDAERALLEAGYLYDGKRSRQWYRNNNYHLQYFHPKKNIIVELHWHILSRSEPNQIAITDRGLIEEWWERARHFGIYRMNTHALCPGDLLFYLCIHFLKHRFQSPNGGFRGVFTSRGSLLQLNDIYQTLKYYSDQIDWETIRLESERYEVTQLIYSTLYVVKTIFGEHNAIFKKVTSFSDPVNLDYGLIDLIQKRLFTREYIFSLSPGSFYESIKSGTLRSKIKNILNGLFPHQEVISKFYSIPLSSKMIYFYYIKYLFDFVNDNKKVLSAKPTLDEARVINKWISTQ